MHTRRGNFIWTWAVLWSGLLSAGCVVIAPGGGDNTNANANINDNIDDNDNDNSGGVGGLQIGFSEAAEGQFASAVDDDGNEYTFFTTTDGEGATRLSEVNILDSNGMTAKATLDEQGRPVSLLGGDGTRANILYTDDDMAKIAVVEPGDEDGEVIEDVEVPSDTSTARKINRTYRLQDDDDLDFLGISLDVFDDFAFSFFAGESAPLGGSGLEEPVLQIASLVEVLNVSININITTIEEVHEIIIIEEVPENIELLDGRWILCGRNGLPADQLGIENELIFGSGVRADFLAYEFDRQNVFDLTNLFTGGPSAGVEIDYLDRVTVGQSVSNDLDVFLTPLYSATTQDLAGNILVDRRFLVETEGSLGELPLNTSYQINAALINGQLDPTGNQLTFDLVVIDLENDLAFDAPIELIYLREGIGPCAGDIIGGNNLRMTCPGFALEEFESATVEVFPPSDFNAFSVYWAVVDGYGFFTDPTSPVTDIVVLDASRPLRLSVALVDVTGKYVDGECSVAVVDYVDTGDICEDLGYYDDGICDSFCLFLDPDCEVSLDICEAEGYYDDGICDEFCLQPDRDCYFGDDGDFCADNGYYGDGICDDYCPLADIDCEEEPDQCEDYGYYGDGICDEFCPQPDPDCFGEPGDFCADNGYYGDGFCDPTCPEPDPDCFDTSDYCAENGWYGDGICDECPEPDPDCFDDGGGDDGDFCADQGYYGDGICDDFCPEPDPDCFDDGDECAQNGYYGDGICDDFCPEPDPDCF